MAVIVGAVPITEMVAVPVLLHTPPLVPTTEYVVFTDGVAVTFAPVYAVKLPGFGVHK